VRRRLFVGTFLPEVDRAAVYVDPDSADKLATLWGRKIRWVRPDKLHLTWLFLGGVEEERIPDLSLKIEEVVRDFGPMEIEYSKFTLWPHARNARTFVLQPESAPEKVMRLGETIKKELKGYAERLDLKYRPHLTLARMDSTSKRVEVPDWFPVRKNLPLVHKIDRVDLIESHLGGNKDYVSIAGWQLAD
jgi:2'-5' RNA ligase